jgi:hypothetical protein
MAYEMHTPLPPLRPVSEADASLRANINELVVHVPCGGIRGTIGRIYSRCQCPANDGVWQSCNCEDEPVRWERCDVSRVVDLCLLCARGRTGGVTKWANLGCGSCWAVNEQAARSLGYRPLPLARHSIRNGAAIRGNARGEEFRRQHAALVGVVRTWRDLDEWFLSEVQQLAESQGWSGDRMVLLTTWQERLPPSRAASRDAFQRFLAVTAEADPA